MPASPCKKKTRIASVSPGPGAYEVPVAIGKTDATRFASICVRSAPAPSISGRQVTSLLSLSLFYASSS